MATRGHGTAAVYGRVLDSVTELYAVMKNGDRVDWPIYDDPRNQERYFAVIADSRPWPTSSRPHLPAARR